MTIPTLLVHSKGPLRKQIELVATRPPDFYDLLLIDIDMPKMNGFDFCIKVFEEDLNPKVCFIVSAQSALREQYPSLSIGCFIETPVTVDNLIRRVEAELE
jgi:DNA-binding response OmpR family regulator